MTETSIPTGLFFIDKSGAVSEEAQVTVPVPVAEPKDTVECAWKDEDDDSMNIDLMASNRSKKLRLSTAERSISGSEYAKRLREQFAKLQPRPKWAQMAASDEDNSQEASILDNPFSILASKTKSMAPLVPDVIALRRRRNPTNADPGKGAVCALDWHPRRADVLLLSTSSDRRLQVVSVEEQDAGQSEILATLSELPMNLKITAFSSACFAVDGNSVIAVADKSENVLVWRPFDGKGKVEIIHKLQPGLTWSKVLASPCGRFVAVLSANSLRHPSSVVLLDGKTLQRLGIVRCGNSVHCMTFSLDGSVLLVAGAGQKISVYSTSTLRCINQIPEESVGRLVTCMAFSPDSSLIALGSDSGVLNIYDSFLFLSQECQENIKPKLLRSIMNITSPLSLLCWHPSGELLAYGGTERKNALRLVHLPSGRVYANWPKNDCPVGYAHSLSFSKTSLVIGNNKGHVVQYALSHFANRI